MNSSRKASITAQDLIANTPTILSLKRQFTLDKLLSDTYTERYKRYLELNGENGLMTYKEYENLMEQKNEYLKTIQ
jgi:hypothetical protein